jgi:chromosome segregation ATPase
MLIRSCSDLTLVGCVVEAATYIDNSLTDSMMRARGKSSSSEPTAEQVRDLEQRNARLKEEISSLSSVLSEKPQRGRSGLAPVESDSSVLQMELKNASKQIEMYEKELGRLESKLRGGTVAERHLRLESLAREKKELI